MQKSTIQVGRLSIQLTVALVLVLLLTHIVYYSRQAYAATLRVPQNYPTIQAAIDAAKDDDVVVVSTGIYTGPIQITGKRITLASEYFITEDPTQIDQTILDGQGAEDVVRIDESATGTKIIGFTIQNGNNGISLRTQGLILNNRIHNTVDGIDSSNGGGFISRNVFEHNTDDGVDFDGASSGTIENNIMQHNEDDGVEVRMHNYDGPRLTITIRGNTMIGNGEDGIQLIDYPQLTNRVIVIERNLISESAYAAIGLMDNGDTREDFRGASIPERIYVYNNTLINNPYALTGGDNLIALNNIFADSSVLALKNVDADSIVAHNLFWDNTQDFLNSNVLTSQGLWIDPLLDKNFRLTPDSQAIDAGTSFYTHNGEIVLDYPDEVFWGSAPDLGWQEYKPQDAATPTPVPTLTPEGQQLFVPLLHD